MKTIYSGNDSSYTYIESGNLKDRPFLYDYPGTLVEFSESAEIQECIKNGIRTVIINNQSENSMFSPEFFKALEKTALSGAIVYLECRTGSEIQEGNICSPVRIAEMANLISGTDSFRAVFNMAEFFAEKNSFSGPAITMKEAIEDYASVKGIVRLADMENYDSLIPGTFDGNEKLLREILEKCDMNIIVSNEKVLNKIISFGL